MINVLFAGNYKVFNGMMISLLSMVKHTKCPINAYVLTMKLTEIDERFIPITEEQAEYLEKILTDVNSESSLKLLDISDMFKEEMLDSVNIKNSFTPYAMARLFADKIEEIPDKIIYLDTDTIINNNLEELYDIDISDYELGCVKDSFNWLTPNRWGMMNTYFNSGVLLLNMKKIRETGMLAKTRKMCHDKKMLYTDQDALNRCVKFRKMLPAKFNAKDKYYPEIVVHHFCGVRKKGHFFYRIKPWEVDLVKTRVTVYNDILDDYEARLEKIKKEGF